MWLLATDITTEHFNLERNCKGKRQQISQGFVRTKRYSNCTSRGHAPVSHPDLSQVSHLGGWVQTSELDIWAKGLERGGSHKLGALGSLFSTFPEIPNVGTAMENKGWGLQAWHALCCSFLSHGSEDNHKLLPVRCSELSDRLTQSYHKFIHIQECLQAGAAMNWLTQTPRFHSIFVVS